MAPSPLPSALLHSDSETLLSLQESLARRNWRGAQIVASYLAWKTFLNIQENMELIHLLGVP